MTNPDFVEVYPDAVIRAGHATANTESLWRTWAAPSEPCWKEPTMPGRVTIWDS
ncbi:hypothetical protein JQS43_16660 [Natronosporangium hydrolyticum]|uniref:Uncharacterized protein n=1 Tax=Natronosporangium hydrolyticum TaxID=2811111 RepID=A0A895Y697_9ACTN|nr:hypothetical protein [Natronosporangium hydrolyticum]QSB13254.1 hypothetical protein JQS43_16660 [Natronosporangium hydrolyticum]